LALTTLYARRSGLPSPLRKVGDPIVVSRKATGTLVLDNLMPGRHLYLLGTGTDGEELQLVLVVGAHHAVRAQERLALALEADHRERKDRRIPGTMSNFNEERVLAVHHWTDSLFSFRTP
jgi:hypothetical protein